MMLNLRGGRGQKCADNLVAEQRLKEEKAMSENINRRRKRHEQTERKTKAGTGSVRPRSQDK